MACRRVSCSSFATRATPEHRRPHVDDGEELHRLTELLQPARGLERDPAVVRVARDEIGTVRLDGADVVDRPPGAAGDAAVGPGATLETGRLDHVEGPTGRRVEGAADGAGLERRHRAEQRTAAELGAVPDDVACAGSVVRPRSGGRARSPSGTL